MTNDEFVLSKKESEWLLHKNNRSATNVLKNAKIYKSWQRAEKRCENTSWEYCTVEEWLSSQQNKKGFARN